MRAARSEERAGTWASLTEMMDMRLNGPSTSPAAVPLYPLLAKGR